MTPPILLTPPPPACAACLEIRPVARHRILPLDPQPLTPNRLTRPPYIMVRRLEKGGDMINLTAFSSTRNSKKNPEPAPEVPRKNAPDLPQGRPRAHSPKRSKTNPTQIPTRTPNRTNPTQIPTRTPNKTNPTQIPTRTPNKTNPTQSLPAHPEQNEPNPIPTPTLDKTNPTRSPPTPEQIKPNATRAPSPKPNKTNPTRAPALQTNPPSHL